MAYYRTSEADGAADGMYDDAADKLVHKRVSEKFCDITSRFLTNGRAFEAIFGLIAMVKGV